MSDPYDWLVNKTIHQQNPKTMKTLLYTLLLSVSLTGMALAQTTTKITADKEIEGLMRYFQSPTFQLSATNVKTADEKIRRLSKLTRQKYRGISLKEQRTTPESQVLKKWFGTIVRFKKKQEIAQLDQQIAALQQIKKSLAVTELLGQMKQEMKAARQQGRWNGWSNKIKTHYQSLQKKGLVSQELSSYYESLNK